MSTRAACLALVAITGCGGRRAGDTAASGSKDTATAARFSVAGTVLDLDRSPVVDLFVTVSTEFCIPDRTDQAGAFAVQEVSPGDKRLITYGETASNGLFASVVFAFEARRATSFDEPVWTPELRESFPVDPGAAGEQQVVTADGLVLEIPEGALTLAPFAPSEVQVARVPVAQAPPFVPQGVELVDLFALGPIQSTLDPPAAVVFPGDTGLPPGAAVAFHALDYDTGLLAVVAHGTVDDSGRPTSHPGEGIPELTWVGVSLE